MQESKSLKLLKLLDKEELRRFKKLLQSPFFTTNSHLLKIYEYLIKYAPNYDSPKITKSLIFTYLFPNKTYNDNKLRMLLREFTKQLEDFLVIKSVRDDEEYRKRKLIEVYGERNQMDLFEKGTFHLLAENEKKTIKERNHFYEQQQLIQSYIYHPAILKAKEVAELQVKAVENLELYYWSNKVWLACNLISSKQFLKVNYPIEQLEFSTDLLSKKQLSKHPPLDIYLKAFQLLKLPSAENYFELKRAYISKLQVLQEKDKRDLLSYLFNFSVRQNNLGVPFAVNEVFNLYQIGLQHKLLIESDKMDSAVFRNCCFSAVRIKEFNWAASFIEEYQIYLNEDERQDLVIICKALLLFYKKDYTSTIELISPYRATRFRNNLSAKGILIRSYFELFLIDASYFKLLIDNSHAFEKFLQRNKQIPLNVTSSYLNFITTLRKMTKSIHEDKLNMVEQTKFTEKIKAEKIVLKQWLLEKLEERKN